ncbi:MAG: NAD(P)/FAD-dependent oxidoreductase [Bacteroidota bacterium]|nr:NAD(P)/FAD-dependent oxidoreductase [Bacteroidota bacterium]
MKQYDLIVIGGGAAGMMAAGHAAEMGRKVLLLEKMERHGRKLAITGKGRCNITNIAPVYEFINNIKPNGNFLRSAFSNFFSEDLIDFFSRIDVETVTERGGRVFPLDGKAVNVVKKLVIWCKKQGVDMKNDIQVSELLIKNKQIAGIKGVDKSEKSKSVTFYAKHVLIATGGVSYPATGSTGDGYKLAKSVGHTVTPILPALVPLETLGYIAKELSGLDLRNVHASVYTNGKKSAEDFGELSFTDFGVTGPIILSLSREIVASLKEKKSISLILDLKSALSEKKLDNRLLRDLEKQGKETFRTILNKLLPKKLIPLCIKQTKIPADKLCNQINSKERKTLLFWLKNFKLEVSGYRPFKEAIVTAGGVNTDEVNQKTMESKILPGLFFAGEVLNLDGMTGGYNLQIAFSTGWVAAENYS